MTTKLVLHTDRISEEQLAQVDQLLNKIVPVDVEVEQYNHNMEISWRDINKYAECETFKQMYEVDPDKFEVQDLGWAKRYIINDLTSDGDFVYPLTSLVRTENGIQSSFANVRVPHFSLTLPSATDLSWCFQSISYGSDKPVKEITLIAPLATNTYYTFANNHGYSLRKINCYLPRVTKFNYFATASGLTDVEGDFSSASTGVAMFSSTKLNKKSALNVLNSIPAHTSGEHELTIGIHVDHKYDPDVNLALKKADINYEPTVELPEVVTTGKGWTVVVQWNGTPTSGASTYGRGQLIYAKLDDVKLPDGTEERVLEWGHYVTNWEERRYEQFRSLESAREYFGLSAEDENLKPD